MYIFFSFYPQQDNKINEQYENYSNRCSAYVKSFYIEFSKACPGLQ